MFEPRPFNNEPSDAAATLTGRNIPLALLCPQTLVSFGHTLGADSDCLDTLSSSSSTLMGSHDSERLRRKSCQQTGSTCLACKHDLKESIGICVDHSAACAAYRRVVGNCGAVVRPNSTCRQHNGQHSGETQDDRPGIIAAALGQRHSDLEEFAFSASRVLQTPRDRITVWENQFAVPKKERKTGSMLAKLFDQVSPIIGLVRPE